MGHYLVTGVAGFIGAYTSETLLQDGHTVIGIDNMNDAYDVRMKEYRLLRLQKMPGFTFHKIDISLKKEVEALKREVRRHHSPGGAGGSTGERGKPVAVL